MALQKINELQVQDKKATHNLDLQIKGYVHSARLNCRLCVAGLQTSISTRFVSTWDIELLT